MGGVCSDEMSAAGLRNIEQDWYSVIFYIDMLGNGVVIACAIVFFGCYRRLSKPTFVLVMWGLFILAEVSFLLERILTKELNNADDAGDTTR